MDFLLAQVSDLKDAAPAESLGLDSVILGEQFYFFTVVLMWLIHVGFMTYETGVARRKNALATAMKNILTIAVVTPTLLLLRLVDLQLQHARACRSGRTAPTSRPPPARAASRGPTSSGRT